MHKSEMYVKDKEIENAMMYVHKINKELSWRNQLRKTEGEQPIS